MSPGERGLDVRGALSSVLGVGCVTALAATALGGARWGASVLVGAAIASSNFVVLAKMSRAIATGHGVFWGVAAPLKLVGLLAIVAGALSWSAIDPRGTLFGLATLPAGILLATWLRRPAPDNAL